MKPNLDNQTLEELLAAAKHLEQQAKQMYNLAAQFDDRLQLKLEQRRLEAIKRSRLSQNPPE